MLLKTWYESIRTKVGKIHDTKSGSAAKVKTDRDVFILAHFGFLVTHICRVKGRTAVSLSLKPSVPGSVVVASGSDMDVAGDVEHDVSQVSSRANTPTPTCSATQQSKGGKGKVKGASPSSKRKVLSDDDDDFIITEKSARTGDQNPRGDPNNTQPSAAVRNSSMESMDGSNGEPGRSPVTRQDVQGFDEHDVISGRVVLQAASTASPAYCASSPGCSASP